jgi:hypothetical protein
MLVDALVSGPPPKSTVPVKYPVTTKFPLPSTATAVATSLPVDPNPRAHWAMPPEEYLAMKTSSVELELLSVVPPKFTIPRYRPAKRTFPFASLTTLLGYASPDVEFPISDDHEQTPLVDEHAGVLVLAVELWADWLPMLSTAETVYE